MDVPASAMPQLLSRLNTIINTSRDGYECLPLNKFFDDESLELKIVALSKLSAQFHVAVLQELFSLIVLHSTSLVLRIQQNHSTSFSDYTNFILAKALDKLNCSLWTFKTNWKFPSSWVCEEDFLFDLNVRNVVVVGACLARTDWRQ